MAGQRVRLGLAAAVLAVAGCISTGLPPPTQIADPGLLANPLRYTCGGLIFDPALFDAPGNAEQADDPMAKVLREYIAQTAREGEPLPETGWHLLEKRVDGADYLATRAVAGEGTEVVSATITLNVSLARRAVWNRCRAEALLPAGLSAGSWTLADPAKPHPGARTFRLAVEEDHCASGRSPEGRIVGPAIQADERRIVILFGIQQLSGAQTCQNGPPALVDVELDEPIGDRALVDPGHWPNASIEIGP